MNLEKNIVLYLASWALLIFGPVMAFYLVYLTSVDPLPGGQEWKFWLGEAILVFGTINSFRYVKQWKNNVG